MGDYQDQYNKNTNVKVKKLNHVASNNKTLKLHNRVMLSVTNVVGLTINETIHGQEKNVIIATEKVTKLL